MKCTSTAANSTRHLGMLRILRVRAQYAACSPARRTLSSKAPALTLEQAMTSSHLILNAMQSPQALQALQTARHGDRLQKWQTANAVLIQSTLQALPQVGFTPDGMGLQRYTEAFAEHARSDQPEVRKALADINMQKWRSLLRNGFGCEPAPPMSLGDARKLAIDMVDAMQDEQLLRQVRARFPPPATDVHPEVAGVRQREHAGTEPHRAHPFPPAPRWSRQSRGWARVSPSRCAPCAPCT